MSYVFPDTNCTQRSNNNIQNYCFAEQALNGNKSEKITVTEFDDDDMEVDIKKGIKTVSYKNQGVDLESDSSTSCDNRGQLKHFSFGTLMQETILGIDLNDRWFYDSQGLILRKSLVIEHCELDRNQKQLILIQATQMIA